MEQITNKYDWIGDFVQGVAIVKKNGKYGAMMVGGKEILPTVYDELSNFEGGYATATYNGENRTVNLSGQIQIKKGKELVFLPEDYDWGYDFVGDICVVIKSGKYGIVDKDFKIIEKPSYQNYSGFKNGYALFEYNNEWFNDVNCIIDTNGKVLYDNAKEIGQEFFIVSSPDGDALYGLIDKNLTIRIPCIYQQLSPLTDCLFVAEKNKINQVITTKGDVVLTLKYGESIIAKDPYFLIKTFNTAVELFDTKRLLDSGMNEVLGFKDGERLSNIFRLNQYFNIVEVVTKNNVIVRNIFNFEGKKVLTQYGGHILPDHDVLYYVSTYGGLYKIKSDGLIYLLKTNVDKKDTLKSSDLPTISLLKGIEVSSSYFNYCFSPYSTDRLLLHDFSSGCRGLSKKSGEIIVSPQYKVLVRWKNNMIIVAKESEEGSDKYLKFGIIDTNGNTLLPFEYGFIGIMRASNQLTYSLDAKLKNYHLATNAEVSTMPYSQTFMMGLIDANLKTICSPKYNKIEVFNSLPVYYKVNVGQETGIIDSKGNEVIQTKYKEIKKSNGKKGTFIVSGPRFNQLPNTNLFNIVNEKGDYIVSSPLGKDYFVPSTRFDWCDDFNNEGYAKVLKDGLYGKVNHNFNLISLHNTQIIKVPSRFSWAYDFKYGYVPVLEGSKWGIADLNFNIVIPCKYSYIEPLCPDYFVFQTKNNGNFGLMDKNDLIICEPKYKSISFIEGNYFKTEKKVENPYVEKDVYEIIDKKGNHIIPIACSYIISHIRGDKVYWIVKNNGKMGVCCEGVFIVPHIYDNVKFQDDVFVCEVHEQAYSNSNTNKHVKFSNVYTAEGELRLCIENEIFINIQKEYETAKYIGLGVIRVMKDGWWGLINIKNDVIAAPEFSYIDHFDGAFAKIGKSKDNDPSHKVFFSGDEWRYMKWGLINTFGDIVIPLEYDRIEKWENGYYLLTKENYSILLSPSLHSILETKDELKNFDNRFIVVKRDLSDYKINGLYDFCGNEIIPADEEHGFSQIEVIENGLLKVVYYKGEYGCSRMAIFNNQGKKIAGFNHCDDITLLHNGFILVECKNYGSPTTYSLTNLQGKDIFPKSYYEIKFLSNGMVSLRDSNGWGLSNIKGNIVIDTNYLDELVFVDGVANIKVKGSSFTQKIKNDGIVIVQDGKSEIELPENVYWGTDYINEICIIRGKHRGYDVIGVVDKKGDIIIPTQYKSICLLTNKTIRVQDGDCFGIFDLKGNVIFPPIFTSIEYIDDERIKVTWNLKAASKWDKQTYIPGTGDKYKENGYDYIVNNRSALCNYKGEVINDRKILGVGKIVNQYASVYKEVILEKEEENGFVREIIKYNKIGIIDLSGNTIVEPVYDSIVLYEKSLYAKVRKEGKYGIIHIPSGSLHIFDDIDIKYMWEIDQYGRCIYSDDCWYDDYSNEWKQSGRLGVLSMNGVVVPLGKYDQIVLLNNGLIKVSNDDRNLYGLLDKDGNEILPIQFTCISSFEGNFATICVGGHTDYDISRKVIGGKWGVIDVSGQFIKECLSDEEEILEKKVSDNSSSDNYIPFKAPSVIISDRIPESKDNNYYDEGYDSYHYDDDEGPYTKYGGYNGWDDNTIDEAFDGNPELTWNID